MNKYLCSLSLLFLISSAANAQTSFGKCDYTKQSVSDVTCFGPAQLNQTTVAGNVSVAGPLKASESNLGNTHVSGVAVMRNSVVKGNAVIAGMLKADHATFDAVKIAGGADMQNSTVNGDAVIAGFLTATASSFLKNVTIGTTKVVLNSSSIKGNLTVKSKEKNPTVELNCHSSVQGTISFTDVAGVVKVTKDSAAGKVVNGTTEISDKKCS